MNDGTKFILAMVIGLALIGGCAFASLRDEANKSAHEKDRAVAIVLTFCGREHLGSFRRLYSDLDGLEQRKIADTWSVRCPKIEPARLVPSRPRKDRT